MDGVFQSFPVCMWYEIWSWRVELPCGSSLTHSSLSACHASHSAHILCCSAWIVRAAVEHLTQAVSCRGEEWVAPCSRAFSFTLYLPWAPVSKPEMQRREVGYAGGRLVNYLMTCEGDRRGGNWAGNTISNHLWGGLPVALCWDTSIAGIQELKTISEHWPRVPAALQKHANLLSSKQTSDEKIGCRFIFSSF